VFFSTENDVIDTIRNHIDTRVFPMSCTCCGKAFSSLKSYLKNTTPVGKPVSYDAQQGNWKPRKPFGTASLSNCACGNTLSISSSGMPVITMWRLLGWARQESRRRDIAVSDLLEYIRNRIDEQALAEPE